MRYAFFICVPVDGPGASPEEVMADPRFAAYIEAARAGAVTGGARLRPASDATTVRVAGDEVLLTDGPFAEAKEYVAGIDFVEAADLDEAIALAAEHPAAADGGSVEVRPVWE